MQAAPRTADVLSAVAAVLAPPSGVGWRLRSERQRTIWALQALAGLAAASRRVRQRRNFFYLQAALLAGSFICIWEGPCSGGRSPLRRGPSSVFSR